MKEDVYIENKMKLELEKSMKNQSSEKISANEVLSSIVSYSSDDEDDDNEEKNQHQNEAPISVEESS